MDNRAMIYAGVFLLALVCYATQGLAAWWQAWLAFFCGIIVMLSKFVTRRTSLMVGIAWVYFLVSAVMIFANQKIQKGVDPNLILSLDKLAATYAFGFLLTTLFFLILKRKSLFFFEEAFAILCVADSVLVISQWCFMLPTGGFLINESMNGCLIAMTYPLLVMRPERIDYHTRPLKLSVEIVADIFYYVAPIAAILLANASVPVIAMAVSWFFYYLMYGHHIRGLDTIGKRLSVGVSIVGFFWIMGTWLIGNFTSSSGRFAMQEGFFNWFVKEGGNLSGGLGPGSFFLYGPHIQTELALGTDSWWVWAHNDFLQVFIESGWLGIILAVAVILEVYFKSLKSDSTKYLGISLITYCVVALFNWPLHNPLTAAFGCFLLASIYGKSDEKFEELRY